MRPLLATATCLLSTVASSAQEKGNSFRHDYHVQANWFAGRAGPEVYRDCRGCHGYVEGDTQDPQSTCRRCHYGTFESGFRPGFETDMRVLREEVGVAGFEHAEHDSLACRLCHVETNLRRPPEAGGDPSKELPIPNGFASCATCHGGQSLFEDLLALPGNALPDSKRKNDDWKNGFFDRLNRDPGMGPGRLGPFLHGDHLLLHGNHLQALESFQALVVFSTPDPQHDSKRASENTCGLCHRSVLKAGAGDLQAAKYDPRSCEKCHRGEKEPLRFRTAVRTGPEAVSRAALTFSHQDHLEASAWKRDKASPSAYARIEKSTCSACHALDRGTSGFPLRQGAWLYSSCIDCHDAGAWTAAGTRERNRDRGWWHGRWEGCRACHTFDTGTLRKDRPTASARMRRPIAFRVETQSHDFITDHEGPRNESCTECHLAEVGELPSRIVESPFRHATHVPPPTGKNRAERNEYCVRCHESRVSRASSQADVGRLAGDRLLDPEREADLAGLAYDPAVCKSCHKGTPPTPVRFAPVERAPTPLFAHSQHPAAGSSRQMDCLECHLGDELLPAEAARDVGVRESARDCATCHEHDADGDGETKRFGPAHRFTGNARADEVQSCKPCHAQSIPRIGVPVPIDRVVIADVSAFQHHPNDSVCSRCHIVDPDAPTMRRLAEEDHVWAKRRESPHKGQPDSSKRGPPSSDCLDCHWSRKMEAMEDDPAASRKQLGSKRTNTAGGPYPGHSTAR